MSFPFFMLVGFADILRQTATIKKEILGLFGTNLFQIADCVSVSFFVNLLLVFGCFWRNHLSKTCDESAVCVGILCSAAGYI